MVVGLVLSVAVVAAAVAARVVVVAMILLVIIVVDARNTLNTVVHFVSACTIAHIALLILPMNSCMQLHNL